MAPFCIQFFPISVYFLFGLVVCASVSECVAFIRSSLGCEHFTDNLFACLALYFFHNSGLKLVLVRSILKILLQFFAAHFRVHFYLFLLYNALF